MVWRPEVLFEAFARAGLVTQAVYLPAGVATPFTCKFDQPELLLLGDQHQSTEYLIEYETAAIPRLRQGDQVQVTNALGVPTLYTARAHAATTGNGYFSRCELSQA